jgi:hypothetical protein
MLVWAGRSYTTRDAQLGYAPDPDWTKVQPYEELCAAAFGEHGVIDDEGHPILGEPSADQAPGRILIER